VKNVAFGREAPRGNGEEPQSQYRPGDPSCSLATGGTAPYRALRMVVHDDDGKLRLILRSLPTQTALRRAGDAWEQGFLPAYLFPKINGAVRGGWVGTRCRRNKAPELIRGGDRDAWSR
jgi:hypothetical protein